MTPELASMLTNLVGRAAHNFTGKYDPRIRTIHADFHAYDDEDNVVVFHHREMVTIAALMNCGVEPRVAAALVGDNIIPLAAPVADGGDFETGDGAHWRLAIKLPTGLVVDTSPYLVWAVDEDGNPHDLEDLDPTHETIAANRLPADLPETIEARAIVRKPLDLQHLTNARPGAVQTAMRAKVTERIAPAFAAKADFSIRACRVSPEDLSVDLFDYEQSLGIAGLIRLGVPPKLAAAFVDQDYAFAAPIGGNVIFPDARPWGHPGANWEPIDVFTLEDDTQWALMMADLGPIYNVGNYDVWSLRGKGRVIGNITLASGKPLHDPTRKAISGQAEYRMMASRFEGMLK